MPLLRVGRDIAQLRFIPHVHRDSSLISPPLSLGLHTYTRPLSWDAPLGFLKDKFSSVLATAFYFPLNKFNVNIY